MPALVWLGRRWRHGSDDFFAAPVLFAGARVVWLILTFVAFGAIFGGFDDVAISPEGDECTREAEMEVFFIVVVCVNVIGTIGELGLLYCSTRGAVLDDTPRKCVPYGLHIRLLVWVLELLLAVYGSELLIDQQKCFEGNTARQVIGDGLLVGLYISVGIAACLTLAAYDPLGKRVLEEGLEWRQSEDYQKLWRSRVKTAGCCVSAERETLEEIAELFAEVFGNAGAVDLVATDVAVGLLLVRRQQKKRLRDEGNLGRKFGLLQSEDGSRAYIKDARLIRSGRPSLAAAAKTLPQEDRELLRDVVHYGNYALGVYGWPMVALDRPAACCCVLACTRARGAPAEGLESENCCRCNVAALRSILWKGNEREVDLVSFNRRNTQEFTPYFVAVDHVKRVVVVALRGTMSVQDVVTDVRAEVEDLSEYTSEVSGSAHKGMLKVALNVKEDIEQTGAMKRALDAYEGYGLVFTGHSLGAGGAVVLAVLYHAQYPHVKCFAYSPPGATVSEEVGKWCRSFVTSLVFGKDIVPRLSLSTIATLRDQTMAALAANPDTAKYSVLGTCGPCSKKDVEELEPESSITEMGQAQLTPQRETMAGLGERTSTVTFDDASFVTAPSSRGGGGLMMRTATNSKSMRRFQRPTYALKMATEKVMAREEGREKILAKEKGRERMFVPGRMLHFLMTEEKGVRRRFCGLRPPLARFAPVWRRYDELKEITISNRMVLDHMPYNNMEILRDVLLRAESGEIKEIPKSEELAQEHTRVMSRVVDMFKANAVDAEGSPSPPGAQQQSAPPVAGHVLGRLTALAADAKSNAIPPPVPLTSQVTASPSPPRSDPDGSPTVPERTSFASMPRLASVSHPPMHSHSRSPPSQSNSPRSEDTPYRLLGNAVIASPPRRLPSVGSAVPLVPVGSGRGSSHGSPGAPQVHDQVAWTQLTGGFSGPSLGNNISPNASPRSASGRQIFIGERGRI
eukprot:Hpha_TRINITY_DN4624_c0_g1::TRINITY_DN4624_c0_g1_i1::g.97154::m.97154/K13806/DAGL; sn1-specific diacylglycerol lipase